MRLIALAGVLRSVVEGLLALSHPCCTRLCTERLAHPGPWGDLACLVADPGREPGSAFSEQLTKRSEPQGGRGRRAQNRSGRVVHADSEHRPHPPDDCAVILLAALKPQIAETICKPPDLQASGIRTEKNRCRLAGVGAHPPRIPMSRQCDARSTDQCPSRRYGVGLAKRLEYLLGLLQIQADAAVDDFHHGKAGAAAGCRPARGRVRCT